MAPRFLRETLEIFQEAKTNLIWNNRLAQNREGCAVQLDSFAKMIRHATKELDKNIFGRALEKKIKVASLNGSGPCTVQQFFPESEKENMKIHVTARVSSKNTLRYDKRAGKDCLRSMGKKVHSREGTGRLSGKEYQTSCEWKARYIIRCTEWQGSERTVTKSPGIIL